MVSAERYADVILLSVKGGPQLLQRTTQKAYFEKWAMNPSYLRLFQSIVTKGPDDMVPNADLQDWQEIFVVLCTFAKAAGVHLSQFTDEAVEGLQDGCLHTPNGRFRRVRCLPGKSLLVLGYIFI